MRRGRPPSFDEVFVEYSDRIYRFCYRLCGNPVDAEDLAQDVFVLAYQGLKGFEGRSSLATWLYRIALHRWQRMIRRRGPTTIPLEDDTLAGQVPDPARQAEEAIALDGALAALPSILREAFLLVKAEGLTCQEAAEALDIPIGTVKWRVHESVIRLQDHLQGRKTTKYRFGIGPSQAKERKRDEV